MSMKAIHTFFIIMIILSLCLFGWAIQSKAESYPITLKNCIPKTWLGGIRWTGPNDYVDEPKLELKRAGSITVMLKEGRYSITHLRPHKMITKGNVTHIWPATILDYREIKVDGPGTYKFGCEEIHALVQDSR